jgi:hypothetical protein
MNIIKYLQSKRIIPSKETIIKNEAKKLAKQVCSPEYFLIKLDNEGLVEFTNQFTENILTILTDRHNVLLDEAEKTGKAINNLKCNL